MIFLEAPRFLAKLREGYDLVQGCRLPAGGRTGGPRGHAMEPPLDWQSGFYHHGPEDVSIAHSADINCGMRAFSRGIL